MTYQQIDQINKQLPPGETYDRWYRAFEGGIRVISKDRSGREHRYSATVTDNEIRLEVM